MLSSFWFWLMIAGVLLIIEMLTVTTYFLWVGIGAIITAVIFLLVPSVSLIWQIIVFAIASGLGLLIGLKFSKKSKTFTTNPTLLNQRGNQYIGQIYTLQDSIINGRGNLKISDTVWQIECHDDLSRGSKVKVIAVDGNRLIVEAV